MLRESENEIENVVGSLLAPQFHMLTVENHQSMQTSYNDASFVPQRKFLLSIQTILNKETEILVACIVLVLPQG